MGLKIYPKIHPFSCNTHHDVTDLVNHGMVKNTKTWISWEQNITFLWNKKILNLCLRWHFLGSYCFVVEVTLQKKQIFSEILQIQCWNNSDHKHTKLFFSPGILTERVICGYFVSIFVYLFYVPPLFLGNHSVFSREILKFLVLLWQSLD